MWKRIPILLAISIVYCYFCIELVESTSENIFNLNRDNHRIYCLVFLNILGILGFLFGTYESLSFWSRSPNFYHPGLSLGGFWVTIYAFANYLDTVSWIIRLLVSGGVLVWLVKILDNQTREVEREKTT